MPFAAPLAIFEGIVAEFIPIVGTYIGGAAPILVAFLTGPSAGLWALGYVIVYQQIENYLLSPRLTAKTMSLHPAVAFAAALIGGALGGLLFAFLALPVAGVIQAVDRELVDDVRRGRHGRRGGRRKRGRRRSCRRLGGQWRRPVDSAHG